MDIPRTRAAAVIAILLISLPGTTSASSPAGSARDITQTARGQQLTAEAAARYTSDGVPTSAADLVVLELADGQPLVAPAALAKDIAISVGTGAAERSASATVGQQLTRRGSLDGGRGTTAPNQTVAPGAAAAAPYWTIRESRCFSLYVDSARFDNCYRILQLINDGVSSKDYWSLKQWGTAFEDGDGLSSLWLYGSRNGGSVQTWEDFGPPGNEKQNCTQRWVGIDIILTYGQNYEVCETWTLTKSASNASPWIRNQWNCAGWFCSVFRDTRQIAVIMEVSLVPGAVPRFTIGYGMGA
jgi:hypothetical protein